MLIAHTMSANQSLRQSHAQQQADPAMRRFLGMEDLDQLLPACPLLHLKAARVLRSAARLALAPRTLALSTRSGPPGEAAPPLLEDVRLLDSTFFPLGGRDRARGAGGGRRGDAGVRLQTLLDPSERLPTRMELEPLSTTTPTPSGGWNSAGLEGMTLIFDLEYYCHAHFERLQKAGCTS